jgi:hypothetical protein
MAGAVSHRGSGGLPGFPAMRGVVPVLNSQAAISAREKVVNHAFAIARNGEQARLNGTPVENKEFVAPCLTTEELKSTFFTQDVCNRGGPVVHDPTIRLIFWQGPATPNVTKLTTEYMEIVEQYFHRVALASEKGATSNAFAVDSQYWEEQPGRAFRKGEYKLLFNPATDVYTDETEAFPTHGPTEACKDESKYSEGPCLLDSDLQKEVAKVAALKSWPVETLEDIYVVVTPKGVGGCFEHSSEQCAYRQYCAYHGDFGGDGMTAGKQTLYADLPFLAEVEGCDSGVHPNEAFTEAEEKKAEGEKKLLDGGADALIDTASHEINETITDPIGSQCDEQSGKIVGCELNAWTDGIGQEIGDKCLPPESTTFGIYGEALGAVAERLGRLFNQEIEGGRYWTQREWSNEAGLTEGGCVQRIIQVSFAVSANARATVPVTLNGSSSGAPGDPATYWVWNFGGGEQVGTASPTISHTFAQPGVYAVGLTAYDAYGNSEAGVGKVEVAAAPPPPPPPTPPAPPLVIKEVIVPGHYTPAQVAAALGLPTNGRKLSGLGPFALGQAQCPPACGVTLQLYARETKVSHKHRTSRWVLVGSAHLTLPAKGAASLTVALNARGKALMRKVHTAAGKLIATVEGQEGGSWQIERTLTLSGSGKAARRARR